MLALQSIQDSELAECVGGHRMRLGRENPVQLLQQGENPVCLFGELCVVTTPSSITLR